MVAAKRISSPTTQQIMSTYTVPIKPATSGNLVISAGGSNASTISIIGGSGGSGGTYYTASTAWSNPAPGQIHVKGDAVFDGNITWQDRDMREWFASVESRLGILQPNLKLEAEWAELAELRMRYVELERQLLEKQQVFDILKKT
jgi:ABC-type histidine transport system ATPase subunit